MTGRFVGLGLLLLLGGCHGVRLERGEPLAEFVAHLERQMPSWLELYGIPGAALALVRDGEVVWSDAFGYADLDRRRELTSDAVFRVESISKSVTAWGIMSLVEQGYLNLDDPVQRYVVTGETPGSGPELREVTVAQLLSNSAGLALGRIGEEYDPAEEKPSLEEYLAREITFVAQPGARFIYSNVGYALLELVVEAVTGRSFDVFMREEVLLPLGMNHSTYALDDVLAASLPTAYDLRGVPVQPYVYPTLASGGLLATVEDVARFVAAGMESHGTTSHRVLTYESVRELHTPRIPISGLYGFVADAYASGHFTERLPDGRLAVWHGGQGHGWMSHFHAVPEAGEGIVILTNSQRSWPLMAVVLDDWARWSGLGSLGMSTISRATTALRFGIALTLIASAALVSRLAVGLNRGELSLDPLSTVGLSSRLVMASLGLILLAVLGWAIAQPYLFVSSIFPGLVGWAAVSFCALAISLIASASFHRVP